MEVACVKGLDLREIIPLCLSTDMHTTELSPIDIVGIMSLCSCLRAWARWLLCLSLLSRGLITR